MSQTPAQGARGGSLKKNVNHTSKCYNCGRYGHWARNCHSPKNKRDGGQQNEAKKDAPTNDQDKNRGGPSTACGLLSAVETSMFHGESPVIRCCFIDTAASGNFTPKIEDLHDFVPFTNPRSFMVANGGKVHSKGNGTVKIEVINCGQNYIVNILHVQWVLNIYTHLFSPGQLIKDGFMVNLHKDGCMVKDPANRLLAEVCEKGNMYPAYFSIMQPHRSQSIIQTVTKPTAKELDE